MVFTDDNYLTNPRTIRKRFNKIYPKEKPLHDYKITKASVFGTRNNRYLKIRSAIGPGKYQETIARITENDYKLYLNKVRRRNR